MVFALVLFTLALQQGLLSMPGSGGKAKEPYPVGTRGVTPPMAIFKVKAGYSDEARQACVEGDVLLSVLIDRRGRMTDVRVLRPIGRGLDEEALSAVKKWRFQPGKKDGQNVAALAQQEFAFRIVCGGNRGVGSGTPPAH